MEKKIVIAKVQVIKGKENDFLSLLSSLVESSREEPGNLVYSVFQEVQNSSEFLVYEEYINEDAFIAHTNSAHFKTFVEQVAVLLAKELDIQMF